MLNLLKLQKLFLCHLFLYVGIFSDYFLFIAYGTLFKFV